MSSVDFRASSTASGAGGGVRGGQGGGRGGRGGRGGGRGGRGGRGGGRGHYKPKVLSFRSNVLFHIFVQS
jgi:hypothetical protein